MAKGMKKTNKMYQVEVTFSTCDFVTYIDVPAGNPTQASYQAQHIMHERYHESFGAQIGEVKAVERQNTRR
jgi:hypothetical protein